MATDPHRWGSGRLVLLHGGNVYSPADPFATAMLVAGDEVAWIGSEGAALAQADGVDEVIDLAGAIVAPAFVDAGSAGHPRWRTAAAEHGIGLVHLVDGAEGIAGAVASARDAPGALVAGYVRGGDLTAAAESGAIGAVVGLADEPADRLAAAAAAGLRCILPVDRPADVDAAISALRRASGAAGLHRIELAVGASSAQVAAIARLGVGVSARHHPHEGFRDIPLAELAAAGVPLSVASPEPWAAMAAAVNHEVADQRISARAAFAALTRGGWRAAGSSDTGVLVPGAAAHYVIWDVADLVVQAPDDRIQAWSTDPRSGTPGLPDVSPGAPVPVLRRIAVRGIGIG